MELQHKQQLDYLAKLKTQPIVTRAVTARLDSAALRRLNRWADASAVVVGVERMLSFTWERLEIYEQVGRAGGAACSCLLPGPGAPACARAGRAWAGGRGRVCVGCGLCLLAVCDPCPLPLCPLLLTGWL